MCECFIINVLADLALSFLQFLGFSLGYVAETRISVCFLSILQIDSFQWKFAALYCHTRCIRVGVRPRLPAL